MFFMLYGKLSFLFFFGFYVAGGHVSVTVEDDLR